MWYFGRGFGCRLLLLRIDTKYSSKSFHGKDVMRFMRAACVSAVSIQSSPQEVGWGVFVFLFFARCHIRIWLLALLGGFCCAIIVEVD